MKNPFCALFISALIVLSGCSSEPAQDPASAAQPATPASPGAPAAPSQPAASPSVKPAAPAAPAAPSIPATFEIPAGTELNVVLIDAISTARNQAGDSFTASLGEPLVV